MAGRTAPIALILILQAALASGCRNSEARPAGGVEPVQARATGRGRPDRLRSFSFYRNAKYGVGFRYPKNFILTEQNPEEGSLLLTQSRLAAAQPGAILLASVIVPEDAFPNTSFAEGHLQLVVNPALGPEGCRELVIPRGESSPARAAPTVPGRIWLEGRDRGFLFPDSVTAGRDFAGFASGVCYEFFVLARALPGPAVSHRAVSLDLARVLGPLERSAATAQLAPIRAAALP